MPLEKDFWNRTPLSRLGFKGEDIAEAKKIISEDPEAVNARDGYGATPLLSSLASGRARADYVELLLQSGADASATFNGGSNIMHIVANTTNFEHLAILDKLQSKPGINSTRDDGNTPLHAVCMQGTSTATPESRKKMAAWLLEHGANPELTNKQGRTPAQEALAQGLPRLAHFIEKKLHKNVQYSDIGYKHCPGEVAWPKTYTPLSSRQESKAILEGYKKQSNLCKTTQIDPETVEKSKMYVKVENGTEYSREINYKRTSRPK